MKTMRYHYTPIEWLKSRTLPPRNAGEGVDQKEFLFTHGGNATWHSDFGREFGDFLTKLNIFLPHHPATLLLDIYLK